MDHVGKGVLQYFTEGYFFCFFLIFFCFPGFWPLVSVGFCWLLAFAFAGFWLLAWLAFWLFGFSLPLVFCLLFGPMASVGFWFSFSFWLCWFVVSVSFWLCWFVVYVSFWLLVASGFWL